jgi:beta-lactamase class A
MRRHRLALLLTTALAACATAPAPFAELPARFAALEARAGGRLGVFVLDTGTGHGVGWRTDERFGMCSTLKLALAGVVLREAAAGRLALTARIALGPNDLVGHSPRSAEYAARGWATLAELAQATQETSDNAAANLLLDRLGGPAAFTAHLRELGDPATRLDRYEPAMNLVLPGEEHDTTTPAAMARLVATLALGDALPPELRARLVAWMVATTTGARRLRAGLPAGVRAGDKTGSSWNEPMANKTHDVAIVWPPHRAPLVIAAYYESPAGFAELRAEDDALLAEIGHLVAAAW